MPIVSISLNDEILSELDKLQTTMGFSGRSEAIRAGIRSFVSEEKQKADLSGNIHAILLVVHNDEFDHVVSGITHNFEDLITTHLHSKIEKEKCMELFLINGDAEKVSTITKDFQTNKNMDTVKLVAL
ncbi:MULTISPECIES: CopG family ribbon-helix-helix protein [Nitrosopumilus]|jgi:CopG family nickel-responsive transcriptional regulator|uniref:Nickel-responsive regulator 1 n=1 Tax=Nitrosopumilus zosterae TaxID=718286 RepID=A0A2S2KTA2_9ARCH|nr:MULTISPECIES: CopG family ribbon-helix-helix protein [Nitrosopumilus]MCV0365827.1 CopG family ribbon-helix-helix protein [Nitrosopumilus sp.]MCV0410847.1 CopG family ribbon-helix-helix protein [Nitrosopumilus sp.]MDH3340956.1 CopG family ribbon-helix-helix protein [Nitrosopumilus sp.]BDQ30037.1 CopG family ribbon-helix-helix protein [Nitrosopumilus zosterae]GBH34859.1 nickel-responsive regulator 1 [Nitrosopumilus zosterae]